LWGKDNLPPRWRIMRYRWPGAALTDRARIPLPEVNGQKTCTALSIKIIISKGRAPLHPSWGIVQRQDSGLWSRRWRFESSSPSHSCGFWFSVKIRCGSFKEVLANRRASGAGSLALSGAGLGASCWQGGQRLKKPPGVLPPEEPGEAA
jgi:hypothetical protein